MSLPARPPQSLGAWIAALRGAEIPVLAHTAAQIEALRANEDAVDANMLGEVIATDPLMTLRLLAFASTHRPRSLVTDTETVIATLVMMGIGPFFRTFPSLATVEEQLVDTPAALEGLREVMHRSHRAARFALGFAVHRNDHDAAVIHLAALLHDSAEMLLWCHAPALALELRSRLRADSTLRSTAAQRELLNVELIALQQGLMKAWAMPELLVRITDDHQATKPQELTVKLAIQLARHTASGWDNAA
jgi:HD-like signal output (HDOD) protein